MAKVQITLDPEETEEEAREALVKAFQHLEEGGNHQPARFQQPVAQDVIEKMNQEHNKMWRNLLRDINQLLEED